MENKKDKNFVFRWWQAGWKNFLRKEMEMCAKALSYSVDAQILLKHWVATIDSEGAVTISKDAVFEPITPETMKSMSEALSRAYPKHLWDPGRLNNIFWRPAEPKIQIPDDHWIDAFRYAIHARFWAEVFWSQKKKTLWQKIKVFYYSLLFKIKKWLKK